MTDGHSVTIEIDADLCVAIYDAQIGAGRLVRRDLLESAVAAPFAGFGGYEPYPTLIEKAARLAYGIAEDATRHVSGRQSCALRRLSHG